MPKTPKTEIICEVIQQKFKPPYLVSMEQIIEACNGRINRMPASVRPESHVTKNDVYHVVRKLERAASAPADEIVVPLTPTATPTISRETVVDSLNAETYTAAQFRSAAEYLHLMGGQVDKAIRLIEETVGLANIFDRHV